MRRSSRWWLIPCLIGIHFLSGDTAVAQGTTADGVQAILRGDYATAVRILRPIAETSEPPDPLAQFFMAVLYDAGNGVPRDTMRACGLYRNAAKPGSPLAGVARDLVSVIEGPSSGLIAEFCEAASTIRSSPIPRRTFTLAPGHVVAFDERGVTVRYQGTEKRTDMEFAGTIVLPARYTSVETAGPVKGLRHFMHFFLWMPHLNTDPPRWTLGWLLSEVVGLELVQVAGDPAIATIVAPGPPAEIDVDSLVHVGVNANGEAEWVVSAGANPRSGVVPFKEPR